MLQQVFYFLELLDNHLWSYIGFPAIIFLGLYLSLQSNFVQIRKFPTVVKTFLGFLTTRSTDEYGVHPLKAFFACVGGCVGLGNIVGICTAIQIGGPGSLFWIWITAILGMLVKYAEVFLGVNYRVRNSEGSYNGGPMYYLQRTFKAKWVPLFVCFLLCIYGVEVYQFKVVTHTLIHNFGWNEYLVIFTLLGLVIFAGSGGVSRVGALSGFMIPFFVLIYMSMGFWLLFKHLESVPEMIKLVFSSAFNEQSAVGGFAGSSLILSISQGIRRGCYTGDVGIGYASVIHSESSASKPEQQASLVIFDIFLDTLVICTTSVMMILVSGVWAKPMEAGLMIQTALSECFPHMEIFMPIFLFLLGYSTINAYFCVGLKCAQYLSPSFGRKLFYLYSIATLIIFSFVDTTNAQIFMSLTGGLLLIINTYGIFRLRKELRFNFGEKEESGLLLSKA
jgi:alanine or glycine:cation symporter, AGCS family